jgi:uncharacterized membrane protein (UPF0127 family)
MRNPTPIQASPLRRHRHLCVWKAALFLVFLHLGVPLAACSQAPSVVIHTRRGTTAVRVEIADTPDKRTTGLMYRRDLAPEAGMLFLFPAATPQKFWMKNTVLPLDMIFIGPTRTIVGIVADARPFSTNPLGPDEPSQYVLEVNAGYAAKHGLAVGDRVEFLRVPDAVPE